MSDRPPEPAEPESLGFEAALAELEQIVRKLETGEGTLDSAIAAYERGSTLRRLCEAKLAEAELKVSRIVAGEGGAPRLAPFDADEPEARAARGRA